jgi:flagellar motor protein MotB
VFDHNVMSACEGTGVDPQVWMAILAKLPAELAEPGNELHLAEHHMELETYAHQVRELERERDTMRVHAENLSASLADFAEQINARRIENEAMRNDLTRIAEAVLEEAISRDWCDDYERFVTEVNGRCSKAWLTHRRRTIIWNASIEGSFSYASSSPSELAEAIESAIRSELDDNDGEDISITVRVTRD